jgi:hypothetical protein
MRRIVLPNIAASTPASPDSYLREGDQLPIRCAGRVAWDATFPQSGDPLVPKPRMTKSLISRKPVHGEVEFNDGEFAEIQTVGIEGIEKDLLLQTIQVHRGDTGYSCEQFQHELPVGSWLTICTTIEVTRLDSDRDRKAVILPEWRRLPGSGSR